MNSQDFNQPVAWRMYKNGQLYTLTFAKEDRGPNYTWEPLYTAPTPRKPLTEDEIEEAVREADLDWQAGWALDDHGPNRFTRLVRAIERAHGITGGQT